MFFKRLLTDRFHVIRWPHYPSPFESPSRRLPRRNRHFRRANGNHRRSGYILLAVLGVLVLMVTVLATLAQVSLRKALAAANAERRLQQRVGADSIEREVLPLASKVFDAMEEELANSNPNPSQRGRIPSQLRSALTIGTVTFDVVLADEDAKLNLNELYHRVGSQRTTTTLRRVLGPQISRSIQLSPAVAPINPRSIQTEESTDAPEETGPTEIPRAFRTWSEVFDLARLINDFGNDAALPNATGQITCWGSGSLNIQRASDPAIQAAVATVLSEAGASRFLSRYKENPAISLGILVQQEVETESKRTQLRRMLAETSNHFSIWIDASTVGRRSLRTFSVLRRNDDATITHEKFSF